MAIGKLIPPTTFTAHSNKLRAKYLEKLASMTLQQYTPAKGSRINRNAPTDRNAPKSGSRRVLHPFRSGQL